MPIIGANSTSTYLTITRDKFIELAHKIIGVLEPSQVLDGEQLQDGIDLLSLQVREVDQSGRWRWTIDEAQHVPITSNTYVYNMDRGLPGNIAELLTATYRDSNGTDSPLKILRAEGYEEISNKIRQGNPNAVYLTDTTDLSLRTLYTYPSPGTVSTQSLIAGPYRCIRSHTADASSEPITGKNWRVFWENGGEGTTSWASGTQYTAPPMIRLLYRRPITDFANADSTPDFPMQWPRLLLYELAFDLADIYSIPLDERTYLIEKAKGAKDNIFPSTKTKTTNIHNKVRYL